MSSETTPAATSCCIAQPRVLKKADPLPPGGLPSADLFVAALSSSIAAFKEQQSGSGADCQIVNATVIEKGDRRGSAYVDFNSPDAAAFAVAACAAVPTALKAEFWGEFPLTVFLKGSHPAPAAARNSGGGAAAAAAADSSASAANPQARSKAAAAGAAAAAALAPTLYIQCKTFTRIHHVFDFLRVHHVTGHADDCIYVASSKRPYFLVDWGKNVGSYEASLVLNGAIVQGGHEVAIKPSTQSSAEYKAKNPSAMSLATKRTEAGQIRQRTDSDKKADDEAAVASFVPLSRMVKKE